MSIQHLRSSTANKRPTPAAMSDGQIAVNTNTASPGLFFKDSAGALIKIGPVHVGTTAPNASPASGGETGNTVGEQWLDTTGGTYVFKVWDGSAWRSESGTFVDVNGDVMTGALGIIAGSAGSPGLYFSGDTNTGLYSPGADQVAISTNGTKRIEIQADGDIDIDNGGVFYDATNNRLAVGTTGPLATFDVKPSSDRHVLVTSSATYASNGIVATNDAGGEIALGIGGTPIQFFTGATERARIDSSGRWLLGTSSSASAGDSQYSKLQIRGNTSGSPQLGIISIQREEAASTITTNEGIGEIVFTDNAGNTFAAVVCEADSNAGAGDYPGRLVFSTTADGASSPTERMRIRSDGLVTIAGPGGGTFLKLANSGGYDGLHEVDNTAYTIGQNSDARAMRIGSGANWLTTGVNLAAGGTSWGTYSDERLKTDIVELTGCLDNIKNIRCVSYRLTDVDKTDSKKRLGVIAQDLVGKYDEAVNASRRSEDDETEYLSVQYSDLVPVLLKALQEASAKIETLEAKVAALEAA